MCTHLAVSTQIQELIFIFDIQKKYGRLDRKSINDWKMEVKAMFVNIKETLLILPRKEKQ